LHCNIGVYRREKICLNPCSSSHHKAICRSRFLTCELCWLTSECHRASSNRKRTPLEWDGRCRVIIIIKKPQMDAITNKKAQMHIECCLIVDYCRVKSQNPSKYLYIFPTIAIMLTSCNILIDFFHKWISEISNKYKFKSWHLRALRARKPWLG
jgi:hypothetical protein